MQRQSNDLDDPVTLASEQSFPASDPPGWIPLHTGRPKLEETPMLTKALYVRLEAKPGREKEMAAFLDSALLLAEEEPATTAWFALRLSSTTFGIFDVFADDAGRDAHLAGPVARALMDRASDLLALAPMIDKIDVVAGKMPHPG